MSREDQEKSQSSVHGTIFPVGLGMVSLLHLLLHKCIAGAITRLQPKGIFAPTPIFPKQTEIQVTLEQSYPKSMGHDSWKGKAKGRRDTWCHSHLSKHRAAWPQSKARPCPTPIGATNATITITLPYSALCFTQLELG